MNSISKKAGVLFVGAIAALAMVAAPTARAQTAEELQTQIQSLLAMIATLQAQLAGGSTTPTTGGACTAMQFTLTHKQGDQGGEVMNVQKFLNANGFTVATAGAGSAGNETSYFGPATKAAVVKFQNAYAAEVLAPVGLSAGTGYWGSSSRAKANAMEIARCSSTVVTPGTGTGTGVVVPTGTGLTVSAPAQPGNSLAPANAANVPFTKFTVTAGASDVSFDSVTVELTGLADDNAFASVALLDENGIQVGITKTLNSNDQATVGETVTVPAGMSKTFTVAGNMASSLTDYAGQVAAFSVVAINTSATVNGSLPISGAQHTINASLTTGDATAAVGAEDPNSSDTKEIGTTNYKFQSLKLTAGSAEDIRVKSVRWNQSGSASASDLANVKLTFGGNTYTPVVSGDYYTFNFGSGVVIEKGLSKEMVLSGDIVSGSASTVIFDIRKKTDLVVTGETYGYGITPNDGTGTASDSGTQLTAGTPWFDGAAVTISAGSFNSVSKSNNAPAANVAKQTSDQILGAFTVDIKGESVTVDTVKFGTQITGSANASDLTIVTLVDQNGAVLAGPEDGAADGFESTGDSDGEGSISFSSVTFPVGVTTIYVKGKLSSDFSGADTVVITTNPTDWTNATGDNTGDSVTLGDSLATANTMTVRAASLTATTLTQPAARNVVAGAADFIWMAGSLDAANSGEDIKVTALSITNTTGAGATPGDIDNVEIWADLVDNGNDSSRGDKYETRVADAEQFTSTTQGADETLSISLDTYINVTKNTETEIAVVADLSSSASTTASTPTHTIDIGSVTAVGKETGTSVSVTPTGNGQAMTVSGGGTLTTSVDSTSPDSALVLDDTTNEQTLAVFRLAASNVEDLDVDSIKIASGNTAVQKFVFYNGSTVLGEKVNAGSPELFLNDSTLVVPADGYKLITIKGVMNNIDGTSVTNDSSVAVVLDEVQTTGHDSGSAVDDTNDRTADTHYVYETVPTVAFEDVTSTTLVTSGNYLLGKIKVTSTGNEDLVYSSATGTVVLNFSLTGATTTNSNEITVKDDNGTVLDSTVDAANTTGSIYEATVDFSSSTLTVPAGQSEYLYVYADTTSSGFDLGTDGDTIQVWLDDVANDHIFMVNGDTTAHTEGTLINRGEIFGQTHVNPS